ncbi:hypothetical protein [Microbispora sp. H13382]|uniref:hypothetical protein n=1 Tax=Microbispora sp. H13382 TaxID=2729112 RepID=UPI0016003851|nr:hypothetical protein [Microbispora sp. H13382]
MLVLVAVLLAAAVYVTTSLTNGHQTDAGIGPSSAAPPITSEETTPGSTGIDRTSSDESLRQATEIDALLGDSGQARRALATALDAVRACDGTGAEDIDRITAQRRKQRDAAVRLKVGALDNGPELKSALVEALTASYDADQAYLAWARRYLAGGCTGPVETDYDYRRGGAHSGTARNSKIVFVALWRPVAAAHGFGDRNADGI